MCWPQANTSETRAISGGIAIHETRFAIDGPFQLGTANLCPRNMIAFQRDPARYPCCPRPDAGRLSSMLTCRQALAKAKA